MLCFDRISKSYRKTVALKNFTLSLKPGIYALLGPNGSGKTTLMNILTDNIKADQGKITYSENGENHRDILSMRAEFRGILGYLPQDVGLYPDFTAEEMLRYMSLLKGIGRELPRRKRKQLITQKIDEILGDVELKDVAHHKINTFSGGMKQRLALAQAVLGDPKILILDEPTTGLDPKQRIVIRNLISKISTNKIIIIATHIVSDIEFIANEVIMLKKGKILDMAPPKALARKMLGKVWLVECDEKEVGNWEKTHAIVSISKNEYRQDGVILRMLASECPTETAQTIEPTLEDYYLDLFGCLAQR